MQSVNSQIHKIIIGTANFGLKYGINKGYKVPKNNAVSFIKTSSEYGIAFFDCAEAYGDVHDLLGRYCDKGARIVTKIPFKINLTHYSEVRAHFEVILKALRRNKIEAVLLHSPDCLSFTEGQVFFKNLMQLKNDDLVSKVGVSVYDLDHIETALRHGPPDVIQLPLNPLDTRLEQADIIKTFGEYGIEAHVRSIFLQGLILMGPTQIPKHLQMAAPHVSRIHECAKSYGLSPAEFCLSFALNKPWVSGVVLGINHERHLKEMIGIASQPKKVEIAMGTLPVLEDEVLNPSKWVIE